MRTETETGYLLKAIHAFKRKFFVVSSDYTVLAANEYTCAKAGSDIVGKNCHAVFYDRATPCNRCPVADVFEKGDTIIRQGMDKVMAPNGNFCLYAYPIRESNAIEAVAVLDFDIPTSDGLEEKLQRSNAFLRNLIGSSVDAIIAADKTGKILFFNDAAVEITGYTADEALRHLNIRDVYPANGAREVMRKLRSSKFGGRGKLKSNQVNLKSKDGHVIPIRLNASIVYEGEKEVATIGFFHDLRETLRMEEELEKTQIQLLQAEKMSSLGKLAAGVAHQLNNPLGGITLFTQLVMEEYDLEEGALEDLRRILKDAQRCSNTVKELLEFARQTRQEMRPHDMNQAISRTLFLLENQAIFQNIEIVKNLEASLPQAPGDIQQLNHLFMNIILNAAEAMAGNGTLTVVTRYPADSDHIAIEISDTGPGIPEHVLPHVFEPFYTTKEEGKGTGLGLSLAYRIVENHRGRIRVKNNPESGASFAIELPLKQENGGDEREEE